MTALIIDDEERAISALKMELQCFPDVDLIGTASDVESAVQAIHELKPEVVFLDIQLNEGTGFDVLRSINHTEDMHIIFTTAYDKYAIEAFKVNAVDYLLKPVDVDDLERAISRISIQKDQGDLGMDKIEQLLLSFKDQTKISLVTEGEIRIVSINDIIRVQAQGNYSQFHFSDGTKPLMVAKTLKEYSNRLEPFGFIRAHVSHLVNIQHIRSYTSREGGYIALSDKQTIPVSQRKKNYVLQKLRTFL